MTNKLLSLVNRKHDMYEIGNQQTMLMSIQGNKLILKHLRKL